MIPPVSWHTHEESITIYFMCTPKLSSCVSSRTGTIERPRGSRCRWKTLHSLWQELRDLSGQFSVTLYTLPCIQVISGTILTLCHIGFTYIHTYHKTLGLLYVILSPQTYLWGSLTSGTRDDAYYIKKKNWYLYTPISIKIKGPRLSPCSPRRIHHHPEDRRRQHHTPQPRRGRGTGWRRGRRRGQGGRRGRGRTDSCVATGGAGLFPGAGAGPGVVYPHEARQRNLPRGPERRLPRLRRLPQSSTRGQQGTRWIFVCLFVCMCVLWVCQSLGQIKLPTRDSYLEFYKEKTPTHFQIV